MKKNIIFISLFLSFFLSGCALTNPIDSLGYANKELRQLRGQHISVVIERFESLPHVDIGLLGNKYYIEKGCYHGGDYYWYNRAYGTVEKSSRYNCGGVYFTTDKDGFIKDYYEDGYIYRNADYRSRFKDLIVIKR